MKKALMVLAVVMSVAMITAGSSFADSDKKGCDKKSRYGAHGGGHGGWLGGDGVTVTVESTDDGVIVRYSAKKKDKIKELQLKGEMMNLKKELKELKK